MRFTLFLIVYILAFGKSNAQSGIPNFYEVQKEMEAFYADPANRDNGYKQFKRAEWYFESRVDRDGSFVDIDKRNMQALREMQKAYSRPEQRSYSGDWEFFGPYIIDAYEGIGRVNRLAFHPTDPDVIYAATAGGGLFYTDDHGVIWLPLTESLPVNNLSGVVIDYDNPDIIYILTGDGDGCCGSAAASYGLQKMSIGVLKSDDGGITWSQTGLVFDEMNGVRPYDLDIHPTDPEILFASTDSGVYRTLDGGDEWIKILNERIYQLAFNESDPGTIYAVGDDNVYRSETIGLFWNDTIAIPALNGNTGRMSLTTCMDDPSILYLVASPRTDSLHRGFYISTDAGESYDFVIDTPDIVSKQAWYDLTIACNPVDVNEVMVGSVGLWTSNQGGMGFEKTNDGTHADIHEFKINPLNNRLYAATDGGVFYTDDWGNNWEYLSHFIAATQYYKIAVSQQDPKVVIAGAQDNGTHRNHNVVTTVMDRIYGKDGMDCAIHPLNDSLMIYSAQDGQFAISRTQGSSEDSLINLPSLPSTVKAIWVTPVAWDPNDSNNIFIGYDPIYRSTDVGATFNPIPDTISGRRILHVAPANSQRIYAGDRYTLGDGTRSFHLWSSSNGGNSWTQLHTDPSFPDTTLIITSLATDPADEDEVWITLGGWTNGQKVYSSSDGGMTWQNRSGTLPNTPVNAIVFEENNQDFSVYIGTDVGIFYRNSSLGDWIHYSNSMPIVEITDLEINTSNGVLIAGTYGRGIWQSELHSACEDVIEITGVIQPAGFSAFFQAADSVIADIPLRNTFGMQVIYQAGNVVHLQEGFHATAERQALFWARNAPCEGGIPEPLISGNELPPILTDIPVQHEADRSSNGQSQIKVRNIFGPPYVPSDKMQK